LSAAHVLVATGSRAFRPPGVPFGDPRVLDSDLINGLEFLPRSIAITGSGIIAVEYAKIFQRLGADVTMLIRDKVRLRRCTWDALPGLFAFSIGCSRALARSLSLFPSL
jgi:pyruvate/2-oxoglutarate dehydrogenase complex dihydrolipoamide dehydrogenase (E3) component